MRLPRCPLFSTASVRLSRATVYQLPVHPFHSATAFKSGSNDGMTSNIKPAAGPSIETLKPEVDSLLNAGWALNKESDGLEKTYYFKTYTKVLDFVSTVGIRSKSRSHHSEMTVRSGSVSIAWTTHVPKGLTEKDTFMARFCDKQAQLIGTVDRQAAQNCHPKGPSP